MANAKKIKSSRKRPANSAPSVGPIVIIGGHEDKHGDQVILREVVRRVGSGSLVIATLASKVGNELWEDYRKAFTDLGLKKLAHLDVIKRGKASDVHAVEMIEKASGIFFTGGDQLRLTSDLGGTAVMQAIWDLHRRGGLVAGTSAGASVMSSTMLVSGAADASYRIGSTLRMAPGFGFSSELILDQHFAERGRIGRLLGAVAQNPSFLGVGIDENTAVILKPRQSFSVLGAGAVYVVDAAASTNSNISEAREKESLSIFGIQMHVLSAGDGFDLTHRRPLSETDYRANSD